MLNSPFPNLDSSHSTAKQHDKYSALQAWAAITASFISIGALSIQYYFSRAENLREETRHELSMRPFIYYSSIDRYPVDKNIIRVQFHLKNSTEIPARILTARTTCNPEAASASTTEYNQPLITKENEMPYFIDIYKSIAETICFLDFNYQGVYSATNNIQHTSYTIRIMKDGKIEPVTANDTF